jgi:hypothetical protein
LEDRTNPELSLKKLLVFSVLLVCVIRIMTFGGVTAMDIANVRAHYKPIPSHSHSNSRTQNFYDTSLSVLFDLPNAIVVSTYILLTLVWAECFLQSRFHTESAGEWQKRWLIGYAVFNTCLYLTQLILYLSLFCADFTNNSLQIFRSILYIAMTGINFIAVLLVSILYIYLSVQFAVSFQHTGIGAVIYSSHSIRFSITTGLSISFCS